MNAIERLSFDYGVTALTAPVEAVLWAVGNSDSQDPAAELRQINAEREKAGKPLAYAPFGHRAFSAVAQS